MNNYFENASSLQEKRAILKELSKPLQELVKATLITSVNQGLKGIYRTDGHTDLKTFHQWRKAGKQVIKGEKALCLWGSPKRKGEKGETGELGGDAGKGKDASELDFFPICYVFSNLQVQ